MNAADLPLDVGIDPASRLQWLAGQLDEARRRGSDLLSVAAEGLGGSRELALLELAQVMGLPAARLQEFEAWPQAFEELKFGDCLRRACIPLRADGELRLLHADPLDEALRGWVEQQLNESPRWTLALAEDIAAYLSRCEESFRAFDHAASGAGSSASHAGHVEDLSVRAINDDESPVVRLVRSTLHDGLKSGASDIHIESTAGGLAVKYRIDGVLSQVGSIDGQAAAEQVVSRIKVLAELDIAERRVPQDGRFKAAVQGRDIDFRVSIMPSIFGEDAVLRILDKQALTADLQGLRLESLGYAGEDIEIIRHLSDEPYGMLLVTGPTGSGKTTTLYAALTEINRGRDKIVTIEDPVEYQLPGVLQIPVNEKKGLTFAKGLRSILRHDPDKIMVGEIRDPDTAQIAIQAALTGHLVFTTVHANNVFDVIGRFIHMQVDPYSLVSALNGIVAQRLLRQLCPACAKPVTPSAALLHKSGIDQDLAKTWAFREGSGCALCRGSGYKGRRAIAEILIMNDEIREMIIAREPIRRLKEAALRNGTRFLRDAALQLVAQGITSLDEANRVTFVS